ncbi:hypothetical protein [Bradyrhizobium sp. CCBAU 45384]|uniref:hypothetical protein n=1 Tax=Bradyrhizobium sp. CCBAU 45384 TaxID=858428 RepID=UPI002304F88F|nr:hypothetical protein [Bradyrhizobium sp. CCBAU 45384]
MTIEIAFFNALGCLPIEIEAEISSGIRRRDGLTLIVLAERHTSRPCSASIRRT